MARCPRCEDKIRKRKSDNWYYCKSHGRVRKARTPECFKIKRITKLKRIENET